MASCNCHNNAHVASSGKDNVIKLWNIDDYDNNNNDNQLSSATLPLSKEAKDKHVLCLSYFILNHDNNKPCLLSVGGDANVCTLDVSSNDKDNNALKSMLKGHANMMLAMEIIHATTATTHDNPTMSLAFHD